MSYKSLPLRDISQLLRARAVPDPTDFEPLQKKDYSESQNKPNYVEIELKFSLPDPDGMREKLLSLGAQPLEKRFEQNIRFDTPYFNLDQESMTLRLRDIISNVRDRTIFTLKKPLENFQPNGFSVRREIETEVTDFNAVYAALGLLGYEPYWTYEKHREVFWFDEAEVTIDHVPFGWFMEIEGEKDHILKAMDDLDISMDTATTWSYWRIFRHFCQLHDLEVFDLTFDNFVDTGEKITIR